MKATKVLVTGAAGFIGSRLVRRLLLAGLECYGVDDLSSGLPAPASTDRFQFVQQDVCRPEETAAVFQAFCPEVVVHLAAIHHIPTCERNPSKALQVNIVGFQNVLDAADRCDCRKVVLASSGAVYDWQIGPLNEDQTLIRARDIYSLSKISNEHQLEFWSARTGASGVAARIFNTIGANDPNAHLIPDILRQLASNGQRKTILLGNLDTRRDYIYVEDTADCLARIIVSDGPPGFERLNVGTGVEYSVRDLVERIAALKDADVDIETDPSRVRRVDRISQIADVRKSASRLQWQPKHSLSEGLRLIMGIGKT